MKSLRPLYVYTYLCRISTICPSKKLEMCPSSMDALTFVPLSQDNIFQMDRWMVKGKSKCPTPF